MKSNICRILLFLIFFTCNCHHLIKAGPVVRSSRMVREIYPEVEQEIPDSSQAQVCIVGDVVYGIGEVVPSEQPCLKCSCTPPDVRCETEICVPQPGCKAIHRPNKCCPDYQCECEHQGKSYGNGERLPIAPGNECWVCYCRGGEIQCAEVGCYTRNDCKPRYISGQCCPKYDHCPPRDPLAERTQTTESQINDQSTWTTLNSITNLTNRITPDINEEGSGEFSSSTVSTSDINEYNKEYNTPITFSLKEIEHKTNIKRADNKTIKTKVDKTTQTDQNPQITIQEVIPPVSEFIPPVVPKESVSISPLNPVTYKAFTESTTDLPTSVQTETYNHPPPVLRIGDQLLFINKGQLIPEKDASTQSSIITLIGAEGLQIGLESGEVVEHIENISSTSEKNIESTFQDTSSTSSASVSTESDLLSSSTTEFSSSFSVASSLFTEEVTVSSTSSYVPEENPYYPSIPEDIMNGRHDEVTSDNQINSSTTETIPSASTERGEEISVIPLRSTNLPSSNSEKILPEILEILPNSTYFKNQTHLEWLKKEENKSKNEPTKVSIPLINEKAALPDYLLKMTAPSDLENNIKEPQTIIIAEVKQPEEITPKKPEKIVVVDAGISKETMENIDETNDSVEYTTGNYHHSSLLSNEDASVETIVNQSKEKIETSDLVEIMPGFERSTENSILPETQTKIIQDDVEFITVHTDKIVTESKSYAEISDKINSPHDDIKKRDVVKKVLKDTFDNPKENIRTDIIPEPDTTDYPDYSLQSNEEQNIVQPIDNLIISKPSSPPASSLNITNLTNKNINTTPTTSITNSATTTEKQITTTQENIQKVNNEKSPQSSEEKDSLSPTTLNVLRDFFKTQFRQLHTSKFTNK